MIEPYSPRPEHRKITRFDIIIPAVAPGTSPRPAIPYTRVRVRIKQPERHINTLYLINMILIPEHLRQQRFTRKMPLKPRLSRLLIKLERNHIIRSQRPRKRIHDNHRIPAERTRSSAGILIPDNLPAARLTNITPEPRSLRGIKLPSTVSLPLHLIRNLTLQLLVIPDKRLNVKLSIAIRTLHLLRPTVKLYSPAAARTLILL